MTSEAINQELLKAAKCFVRWVDDCWAASEVLCGETLQEYEAARDAIFKAENTL